MDKNDKFVDKLTCRIIVAAEAMSKIADDLQALKQEAEALGAKHDGVRSYMGGTLKSFVDYTGVEFAEYASDAVFDADKTLKQSWIDSHDLTEYHNDISTMFGLDQGDAKPDPTPKPEPSKGVSDVMLEEQEFPELDEDNIFEGKEVANNQDAMGGPSKVAAPRTKRVTSNQMAQAEVKATKPNTPGIRGRDGKPVEIVVDESPTTGPPEDGDEAD